MLVYVLTANASIVTDAAKADMTATAAAQLRRLVDPGCSGAVAAMARSNNKRIDSGLRRSAR
jgi:hypothetical protein